MRRSQNVGMARSGSAPEGRGLLRNEGRRPRRTFGAAAYALETTVGRRRWSGLPLAALCVIGAGAGCVVPLSSGTPTPAPDAGPDAAPDGGSSQGGDGAPSDGPSPSDGAAPGDQGNDGSPTSDAPPPPIDGPPPSGSWVNVTGNLANMASTCASLAGVEAKQDEDLLIASVAAVGLFGSRNGGQSWQPLGGGSGASPVTNRMTGVLFDPQTSTRWWEVGIYGASPFATQDDGKTLVQNGMISHTDYLGVDFTDPARMTMVAGGHEMGDTVYLSTNGGSSWNKVAAGGLPSNAYCTIPLVVDANTFLVGCAGAGIWRTTDRGVTWQQQSTSGGATPPLIAHDGTIYWIGSDTKMASSSDHGVTWTALGAGGVIAGAGGGLTNWRPMELPDGRIAAVGTKAIMATSDKGATWSAVTTDLPITSGEDLHGAVYSLPRKAFYVWHNSCQSGGAIPVPADAIMRFDYDVTKP